MYGCKCIEKSTENARIWKNTFFLRPALCFWPLPALIIICSRIFLLLYSLYTIFQYVSQDQSYQSSTPTVLWPRIIPIFTIQVKQSIQTTA